MKMQMISTKGHRFGGKWRNVGDTYEASRHDARLMQALKHSEPAPAPTAAAPEPSEQVPQYRTRMLVPEPPVAEPAPPEAAPAAPEIAAPAAEETPPAPDDAVEPEAKPKRQYRRRDLVADTE